MQNPFEAIDTRLANIESLLADLKRPLTTYQPEVDEVLIIKDAAKVTHLAVSSLYALVSRNEIPFFKKSNRLYFSKFQLLDWIKSGKKKTAVEIAAEANAYLATSKKAR